MSRPISDAQIYMLLWAERSTHGSFSELHDTPLRIKLPGRREVCLLKTVCDRPGLLGLGRRGLMRNNNGLWTITAAGRAELTTPALVRRIAAMVEATKAADLTTQAEHDALRTKHYPPSQDVPPPQDMGPCVRLGGTGRASTIVQSPITDAQIIELQHTLRNHETDRGIHSYIHTALSGDVNARYFCAGVWEALHMDTRQS